jgi:hypothetical protein
MQHTLAVAGQKGKMVLMAAEKFLQAKVRLVVTAAAEF